MMLDLFIVRIKAVRNIVSQYARRHPFRFLMIVTFIVLSLVGIYLAISSGLGFLVSLGGLGTVIIRKLFFILFFILFIMIGVSFGIIFYTSGIRSSETEFLMTLPIPAYKISFFKFIEAVIFSSWIPFVGIIIFLFSYVRISREVISLWLVSPLYILPFIIISCFTGYLITIFVLKFLRYWRWMVTILVGFVIFAFMYIAKTPSHTGGEVFYFLSREVVFFKISQCWFLPFSWLSRGIINLENGRIVRSIVYLTNLWTLSALGLHLIFIGGGGIFRGLFYRLSSRGATYCSSSKGLVNILFFRKRFPNICFDFFLKDLKLFMREPVLWLQFFIFFGLLFFYFVNLRRFSYHLLEPLWKNLIVFLNVFSVLSTGAALSVRFIFPQWSLEGRNYWILKLSPVPLGVVYFEKFLSSFVGLSCVFILLIFTSNQMLDIEPVVFNLTLLIMVISAFSLVGISLGLGAYFAEFKLENYLKVVESLGGVVALVSCFGYVVVTVFLFTSINHLYIIGKITGILAYLIPALIFWIAFSAFLVITFTIMGFKKLKSKEY